MFNISRAQIDVAGPSKNAMTKNEGACILKRMYRLSLCCNQVLPLSQLFEGGSLLRTTGPHEAAKVWVSHSFIITARISTMTSSCNLETGARSKSKRFYPLLFSQSIIHHSGGFRPPINFRIFIPHETMFDMSIKRSDEIKIDQHR